MRQQLARASAAAMLQFMLSRAVNSPPALFPSRWGVGQRPTIRNIGIKIKFIWSRIQINEIIRNISVCYKLFLEFINIYFIKLLTSNKHYVIIYIEHEKGGAVMNIGYVRVSTVEQNEGRQIEALKKHNIDKWFTEKVSAKDTNRKELQAMLDFAREGDTIYIHDFSRLARSTADLLQIVEQLKTKGIHLVSNKESLDTSNATGKLMLTMIAAINEFERANLLERQREGIALAVQEGKYKGRKKIDFPAEWETVYNQYKHREISANKAMEVLDLKRNTFYNLLKEHEEVRAGQ